MSHPRRSGTSMFGYLFAFFVPITFLVWLLRGFGILTGIPGGIILLLIVLSIGTGIIYGIEKTKGF
ncbi:MAG: hypothetical protein AB4426_32730 [Xenococcaceae cyanobacterium]